MHDVSKDNQVIVICMILAIIEHPYIISSSLILPLIYISNNEGEKQSVLQNLAI